MMTHKSLYNVLIKNILDGHLSDEVTSALEHMHPAEIADVFEALPPNKRKPVWRLISDKSKGEVLLEVRDEVKCQLIENSNVDELKRAVSQLQIDEIADLDDVLPAEVVDAVVREMDHETKQNYEIVKDYPDDTAGGLMDIDAMTIRASFNIAAALRYMKLFRKKYQYLPEHLDSVFVVDAQHKFQGTVSLHDLVSLPEDTPISTLINKNTQVVEDTLPTKKVAKIFEDKDLVSVPVVDSTNRLLGRITIDDVVDVIRQESEKLIMQPAGLSEKTDVFSPVFNSIKQRSIWHSINLMNAFAASLIISIFSNSIEQIVALAILMPVVASMAGVAGNQALTLVIRGLALDQITDENKSSLLKKEFCVGLFNGIIWAIVVGCLSYIWNANYLLSVVFAISLLISLWLSVIAGTVIPLILTKLKIDPALAGNVILVAISDIASFFIFLGIATHVLVK